MQLRIAMLSVHTCPLGKPGGGNTGGMNVYIRELSRELGRQGHLVDIFTRSHDSVHNKIVELSQNARLIHLRAGENEEIHKLAIYPHLADFACDLENFRKYHGLQYDLIHSHYWLSGWVGKWVKLWWNIPHIAMFHTLGAVKNTFGIGEEEPELRINTEKELAKDFNRIIAPTEREKVELIHYYGASSETISVIPCGVNLDLFQPIDKEFARQHLGFNDETIILFIGRIDPIKGIDELLMAVSYLKKQPRLKLVIVGGDEHNQTEVDRLKGLSKSLRLHDSVTFIGLVKQERLPYFYSAADLCVIPSYYESFGLVALESLACGTPVVATNVGGMQNVVKQGKTGYIVKDNTPRRLAGKIARILSMPKAKTESINSIRASVTKFSWENIAGAVLNEYQTVLEDYSSTKINGREEAADRAYIRSA